MAEKQSTVTPTAPAPASRNAHRRRPPHPGAPLGRARQGRLRRCSDIAEGETLIEYVGEIITWKEAQRRHPHDPDDPNHTFYFHVDDKRVIDANVGGNAARWINHSCKPNCEADEDEDGRVFIKALRNIKAGEELNYDYGLIIDEPLHARSSRPSIRCLVRREELPRHDARAQARAGASEAGTGRRRPSGRRSRRCCPASRSKFCPRSIRPTPS